MAPTTNFLSKRKSLPSPRVPALLRAGSPILTIQSQMLQKARFAHSIAGRDGYIHTAIVEKSALRYDIVSVTQRRRIIVMHTRIPVLHYRRGGARTVDKAIIIKSGYLSGMVSSYAWSQCPIDLII